VTKGTPSFGRHNKKTHSACRRCGKHAYNIRKGKCAHCGYPTARRRKYGWQWKKPVTRERKK